jgi:hypothetical protein
MRSAQIELVLPADHNTRSETASHLAVDSLTDYSRLTTFNVEQRFSSRIVGKP